MDAITKFFRNQARGWLFFEALLLATLIACCDYLTGYEVSIFPFYSVPILLLSWFGSIPLAVAMSVLCALTWFWVDVASGHFYSSEWLRIWDAIARLMFFGLVIFASSAIKQQRNAIRTRVELLERSQKLEQEIISISELEQRRIAQDLHDEVCQSLSALGFTASVLEQDLQRESHPLAGVAGEIAHFLQDTAKQTHDLARGLFPVDRDEGGLESALAELAFRTSKLTSISCTLICPDPVEMNDEMAVTHLFRIAQEATRNATKHARAKAVVIALERRDGLLSLRISDDGSGFDPTRFERKGMGLRTMSYRARTIGAQLEILQNSPTGTVVACTLNRETGTNGERVPERDNNG
jgi:signal transduction histidine kinase